MLFCTWVGSASSLCTYRYMEIQVLLSHTQPLEQNVLSAWVGSKPSAVRGDIGGLITVLQIRIKALAVA